MPNLVTHCLCGMEAVNLIKNKSCRELISSYQNIFNLGTQGPDVLFYYRLWPWAPGSEIPNIGEEMHASKVNLFFKSCIDYIIEQPDHIKNILSVYFMGYLCHNCLDSIAHPYVYYKAGFRKPNESVTSLKTYYHRKLETAIDVLLCKKILGKKVHEIHPEKLIDISSPQCMFISHMYERTIKAVFNYSIPPNHISRAIEDMTLTQKLLHDTHGIKKKIIESLEKVIFGFPLYSSVIFPLEINDGIDYLNEAHTEWCMPYDNKIKNNMSFLDIFEQAAKTTANFIEACYHAIFRDHSTIVDALRLFGNKSFNSGVDCNNKVTFKYFDMIFES